MGLCCSGMCTVAVCCGMCCAKRLACCAGTCGTAARCAMLVGRGALQKEIMALKCRLRGRILLQGIARCILPGYIVRLVTPATWFLALGAEM
jgi:hypothetical protein